MRFGRYGEIVNSESLDEALSILDMSGMAERFVGTRRVLLKVNQASLASYLSRFDDLGVGKDISDRFTVLLDYYETAPGHEFIQSREPIRAKINPQD
jgi:hypothetical protein